MKLDPELRKSMEDRAFADYNAVLGKTILANRFCAFKGNDSDEFDLVPPVRFRIVKSHLEWDIRNWADNWLDPIYCVEPVDADPRLEGLQTFWIYAKSYNIDGNVSEATWVIESNSIQESVSNG